jgi:hypothetical protein
VGMACALLLGANVQAQTLTASQQQALTLAAELYPDLFKGNQGVQQAQGYTYLTFSSGVAVGFKDADLYVRGGPFGPDIQKRGTVAQVTTQLTNLKNSVAVTPTADMTNLFTQAAKVYPNLFTGGSAFQTDAEGYLYKVFSSGVYAAIKNGNVYLKGGAYGTYYTSVGALNALLNQLNGNNNQNPIPTGNYNLAVTGTVSVAGVTQGISLNIANIPAPDVSDHDDIEEAFGDAMTDVPGLTITSFTYDVVSSSSNLVEFNISVAAVISQMGFTIPYTYKLNYKYTK